MYNMNSGYDGYRMSKRAVEAYEAGQMPMSNWTKDDIIKKVSEYEVFTEEVLKRYSKSVLAEYFLKRTSWHHTGTYCNETDFYSINDDTAINGTPEVLDEIKKNLAEKRQKEKKQVLETKKAKVSYLEWSGTRAHPKAIAIDAYAIIINNWAYLEDGSKKKVNSKYFLVYETYTRAPKGTAQIFKKIIRNLPKSLKEKSGLGK